MIFVAVFKIILIIFVPKHMPQVFAKTASLRRILWVSIYSLGYKINKKYC